jgi:hypothetical protein
MGAKYLWGKYCSAIYWELYYTIMGKHFFPRMESSRLKFPLGLNTTGDCPFFVCLQAITEMTYIVFTSCWIIYDIWVNYNDLTATSLESWLIREIIR